MTAGLAVACALAVGLAGCGGSGKKKSTTTSSSTVLAGTTSSSVDTTATTAVGSPTTRAGSATTRATTASTTGTGGTGGPASTSATARPATSITVTLFLPKGAIPPGQTQPLDAPAWKAIGAGWDPGHVDLVVKRNDGPIVLLDIGAEANADGRFEQTFVVLDVDPGTYRAIASQGPRQAEASFVI